MKASHLRSILTHLLAFLVGCGVAVVACELHLGVAIPGPLRDDRSVTPEATSKIVASSRRFLIVEGRLGKSFGPETYYTLWDRCNDEVLAMFTELDPSRPLVSRTLYRPGKYSGSEVANVDLDKKTYQVSFVECSTGLRGEEDTAECIYDTNADGVFDVLRGFGKAPDHLLLRTAHGWATARDKEGTREVLVDDKWVPVIRHEDGFWEPE